MYLRVHMKGDIKHKIHYITGYYGYGLFLMLMIIFFLTMSLNVVLQPHLYFCP